jgi:hypothetical protein
MKNHDLPHLDGRLRWREGLGEQTAFLEGPGSRLELTSLESPS